MNKNVKLLRAHDNQIVDASLLTLSDKHLDDFETFWKHRLQASSEEDRHWDWAMKSRRTTLSLNYEKYALECDRIAQGLMMLEIDFHRSRLEPPKDIVYVDFLATAPWNRPSVENLPTYKGVGSALFDFAVLRSFELGYRGRVGLHALPRAAGFYTKKGMADFGTDPDKENLTYFELCQGQRAGVDY